MSPVKAKRRKKMLFAGVLIVLIIILAASLLAKLIPGIVEQSGYVQAVVEFASIIFAALTLRNEMSESQRLEEAEFIVSLNEKFSESEECKKVFSYAIWEANRKRLLEMEEEAPPEGQDERERWETEKQRLVKRTSVIPEEPSQIELSTYLTFFESIFLLLESESISWEVLDELFKYRFYAGVHCDYVQHERLTRLPANFKNIYYLEALWIEYDHRDEKRISRFDDRLEMKCDPEEYRRIIDEMESRKHMLEGIRMLDPGKE